MGRLSVLLTTEESYPYHQGDVGTWCHSLTKQLSEVDFTLLSVTRHPYLAPLYPLAPNVQDVIDVPWSGMEDPAEYGNHASLPDYLRRRWSMTGDDVEQDYLPHFERFLHEVANPTMPARGLGLTLLQMHLHLRYYDYACTQAYPAVWSTFVRVMQEEWRGAYPLEPSPTFAELAGAWRQVHRLLMPLSIDLPRYDVTHSAAAAFCGLPCIMARLRHHTPYLLTEHGVYLRERYLDLERETKSLFVRWFLSRLINAVVDVNYAFADQISPVCKYNTRWEQWRGVDSARIRIIYNGADPRQYRPAPRAADARPTVVSIGQIAPLKGQADLIEAAALVRRAVPNVEFRFYGAAGDEEYYRQCRDLAVALGLQDTVVFAGIAEDLPSALQQAHVVALSSVSDGLPSSVVEAMLSEAAVVATNVGGASEALGETGLLVPPRDPVAMAEAIATLLRAPDSCRRLGEHARKRATHWFSEERFAGAYRSSYNRLAAATSEETFQPAAAGGGELEIQPRIAATA
jgi:glycosyltransferase involved in cell wall biosynthesis